MMEERRLAAIMFTDIVGYTAMAQRDEPLAIELLEEHRRLLRQVFPQHQGREIETAGDSFLVEFSSAVSGVRCAVEIQKIFAERNAAVSPERQVWLRIGLHIGDVAIQANRPIGDVLNIASRIEHLCEPGGICISEDVARQVRHKIDLSTVSLGTPVLKNVRTPLEIYKVLLPSPGAALSSRSLDPEKSIAVLPFANLSTDPENEYFSDGLTDDIIAYLSRISELKVISRTSTMQYKKTTKLSRLIGHELGVATILEGSVRRAGTRVRIVAQLINAQTDAHLWAEAYDRELTDIFAIQSDVARQIATALKARISPSEQERLQQKPTLNLEAYNLYLQGRYFFEKRIEVTLKKALALFEEAIQKDPQYALAYTGIADTYGLLSNYGVLPSQEAFKKATEAAQKAIEIDGTLAEAQTSLAVIKSDYEWDWVGAERYFVRAIEMNPGYARARQWYALYLAITGRHDRALREIRRAQELDPLSLSIQASVGLCFLLSKNYAEAINALLKTVELDVNFAPAYLYLAWAYGQKRMYEQAVEASLQYLSLDGQSSETLESLQEAFKTSGWQGYLRARIDVLTRQGTRSRYDRPVTIAGTYLLLGEKDQALAWLEKAYEQRDSTLGFIKTHPVFEELHSDVRFIQLLRKMGLG